MIIKYAIFKTSWGFFGIAGTDKYLLRTHLPVRSRKIMEKQLLKGLEKPRQEPKYLLSLQRRIKAYLEGKKPDDFSDIPVKIQLTGNFPRKALAACRKIRCAQTISYSQLAELAGNPKAARAAGSALSKNPLPLIIPCHRVIRSNGTLGGFTTSGGLKMKKKMLNLEADASKA